MATRSRRGCLSTIGLFAGLAAVAAPGAATAKERVPQNLANGLERLVAPPPAPSGRLGPGPRLTQGKLAIRDAAGRVLVTVRLAPGADLATVERRVEALGLHTTTRDPRYRTGLIEGFAALDRIAAIATAPGVGAVVQAVPARPRVGSVTSQGVQQERADRLPPGVDGSGVTVGILSDSFDTATSTVTGEPLTIHAADDVASGDLPGPGNPLNSRPVVVLEDFDDPTATDEGRGILQIVHDVAPQARLCFATAAVSATGFAQNIRRLADPAQGCGADIIDDDIGYFDEPMFQDGEIAQAVDDVAAQGVHYFSSAGNNGDQQGYDAAFSPVAPDSAAVAASGLDLSHVDPSLYAGGFHDFDAGPGVDIAQTTSVFGDGVISFQWDDPFDAAGPQLGATLLSASGELTDAAPEASFPLAGTAGQQVLFKADAVPSGSVDLVLTVLRPDGEVLVSQDASTSPEQFAARLPATGTYTVKVTGFAGATGPFTVSAREIVGGTTVSTDYNLLFFDDQGNFVGSASDNNPLSGRPIEVAAMSGTGDEVRLVIARGNDPAAAGGHTAERLRYVMGGGWLVQEHRQLLAPTIQGHPAARGATAVGAYGPFTPETPEDFTSAGGDLPFFFDPDGRRLPRPDVRRKPEVSGTDGGNTTFFAADTVRDADAFPNFFGTSASAPHVAAIAALVLDGRGGGRSLSPDALRDLLEDSTFPHDLDPYAATASGDGLTIQARAEAGSEAAGGPTATMRDPNVFTISYGGPGSVTSLTLDGDQGDPTGLRRGLAWDPRPFDPAAPAASGSPFAVGATSPGIDPASVTATFARPAPAPAVAGQFREMTVNFAPGALTDGRSVAFGVDRDEVLSAFGDSEEGNSADLLSDGVRTPEDDVARGSVRFEATLSTGRVIRGELANRIGFGFSPLDGFGLVDAVRAVGDQAPGRGRAGHGRAARVPSAAAGRRERRSNRSDPRSR
jgi:hypothetical protein